MIWFFVIWMTCLLNVDCQINSTSQVYGQLQEAVSSDNSNFCNEILDKYFFTENKDSAIWTYAMKETKDILQREFSIQDHITMDKDIKNIRRIWRNCREKIDGDGCEEIFQTLHKSLKDFQWQSEGEEYFKVNYISLRVAFQSMVVLMFSSMVKEPWVNTFIKTIHWYNNIQNEYDEITKYLTKFPRKIHEERPFEIESEVCEVKTYLWKDFVQPACEKRWMKNKDLVNVVRRSLTEIEDDGDDDIEGKDTESSDDIDGKDTESGDDIRDEDGSNTRRIFFEVFANPDFESINIIGGKSSEYHVIMQSRLSDFGGKMKVITGREEFNIREKPKAEVIERMIDITLDKRSKYAKEKLKQVDDYIKQTFDEVEKASNIFVSELKKRSTHWKEQINNNNQAHAA